MARSTVQSAGSTTAPSGVLVNRHVVLCVTGSIAAYKAPFLLRLLQKEGATVEVVLTNSASEFVGSATFAGLGAAVHRTMWASGEEVHVALAQRADLMLVVPATADCVARLAHGRADDLLCATALCFDGPLFVCPALHPSMWNNAATRRNVELLEDRGVHFIGPVEGEVASGDSGVGRLAEPDSILEVLTRSLKGPGDLSSRHIVVTAGPTSEALDPVRTLTNRSSGKMGYAIASVAVARGAAVTLISGPVSLPAPTGVDIVRVESASEMQNALDAALGPDLDRGDALIMAAAVSDFRPQTPSSEKLKRDGPVSIDFEPNPDLLASLGKKRTARRPVLVGFALETATGDGLIASGRRKLIEKRVDLVVANGMESLGRDSSEVLLVSALDCTPVDKTSKLEVASQILDWVAERLEAPARSESSIPPSTEFSE